MQHDEHNTPGNSMYRNQPVRDRSRDHPWDYFPDVKPGSKISFKRGDESWTQTVDSITYSTQPYAAAPKLSRRERIIRWFTHRHSRELLPQPSGGIPVVTIKTSDPFDRRTQRRAEIAMSEPAKLIYRQSEQLMEARELVDIFAERSRAAREQSNGEAAVAWSEAAADLAVALTINPEP